VVPGLVEVDASCVGCEALCDVDITNTLDVALTLVAQVSSPLFRVPARTALQAGQTLPFAVAFSSDVSGMRRAVLTLAAYAPDGSLVETVTVPVTAMAVDASIDLSPPQALDFGVVLPHTRTALPLQIANTSAVLIPIVASVPQGSLFTLSPIAAVDPDQTSGGQQSRAAPQAGSNVYRFHLAPHSHWHTL
jgi:hypothetical protein